MTSPGHRRFADSAGTTGRNINLLEQEKMAKEEIFEKLKELVVDQLGVEEDEVTMEASMQDDLGADSLDLVDLVMSVEEEFGVKVADEDLENIKTVGDIVDYIEENKA